MSEAENKRARAERDDYAGLSARQDEIIGLRDASIANLTETLARERKSHAAELDQMAVAMEHQRYYAATSRRSGGK